MSLIKIEVQSTRAVIRSQEPLTVGLQGAKVQFSFGQDWKNLTKTAVFRQGEVVRTVANVGQEATIPWEVLTVPGVPVQIGIYGIGQGKAIPTLWTTTQPVRPGADPQGDPSKEPTPGLWEQMQSQLRAMEEAVTEVQEQPRSLIVTVIQQPDGTYIADCDPEQIKQAVEDQWILGCYWYDKDMMLSLSAFQPMGPYTFTAVCDATEYRVLISQSGVVTCSETDLWDSSVKVTVTEQSDGTYTADLSHEQLLEAYNNGKILFCLYSGKIMPLVVASKPQMVFGCVYSGQVYTVTVGISRVTVKTVSLASNEESVLYTPQTLTPEQQAQALANLGLNGLPTGGGNVFDFTTTCPDAVKQFALTLPTTWDKIKMLNIHFNFGKVETPFNLYADLGGKTRALGEIAVGGGVGLNLFFVKNTANQLGIYKTSNLHSHSSACAIMGLAETARYGTGSYAFAISSNTTGVPLPVGTTIEIWGIYE